MGSIEKAYDEEARQERGADRPDGSFRHLVVRAHDEDEAERSDLHQGRVVLAPPDSQSGPCRQGEAGSPGEPGQNEVGFRRAQGVGQMIPLVS